VLESTSLSEYMIEYGGPVVAGQKKELAEYEQERAPVFKPPVVVESITKALLADKLKYQDLPMLIILLIHRLTTMLTDEPADQTATLAYIGITLMSLFSNYVSYRWPRETKEVDLKGVVAKIQDRLQEAENRREERAMGKGSAKDSQGVSVARGETSDDTDRSEADSRSGGLDEVAQELAQLSKDKGLNSPPNLDDDRIPKLGSCKDAHGSSPTNMDQLAPGSQRGSDGNQQAGGTLPPISNDF